VASKKGTKMKDKILTKILAISFILVIVTSCIVPCIAVDNSANNVPNLSDVNNAPSLDKSLPDYLRIGKEGYYPSVPERSIIEITSEEAKAMLQADPNVILLDVRTPTEFSSEHIRGARCVPLSDLKAHISALDRSSGIVIYSDSGVESEEACEILTENGFRRVYNLLGGIEAWKGAGGEVSGSGEAKFEGGITHATYPKSKTCFYKGFSAENISYENITGANLQITSSDEQKLVEGLSVSESGQKTTITFEDLVEGQVFRCQFRHNYF
jgi:rhodanese-related sulfurtransferase